MRQAPLPILTRAELDVMKALWHLGAGTVHDVVDALPRHVAYTTALTMLRILEQKGYVTHEPNPEGGRAHLYRPTVGEDRVRRSHVKDLVDRLFGGNAEQLAIGLLREEKLTRAELEALRTHIDQMLDEPEGGKRSHQKIGGGAPPNEKGRQRK